MALEWRQSAKAKSENNEFLIKSRGKKYIAESVDLTTNERKRVGEDYNDLQSAMRACESQQQ